jgi:hypothetical protein
MITIELLNIYKKYHGDIDALVRCGTKEEKIKLNDAVFMKIKKIIQDMYLVQKGLASEDFKIKANNMLRESCKDEQSIEIIKSMVEKVPNFNNQQTNLF